MAKTSPTHRTLASLRAQGWTCEIVEHWNAFARVRKDLFGGIDIVGLKPGETLGVQCTSASNQSKRLAKLKAEPKLKAWIEAGNRLQCWGWSKKGKRGERKTWQVSITEVTLETITAI